MLPTELQKSLFDKLLGEKRAGQASKTATESGVWLSVLSLLYKISNSPGLILKKLQKSAKEDELLAKLADCFQSNTNAADVQLSGKMSLLAKMLKHLKKETDDKIILVSNFTQTLDLIEEHCKSKLYSYVRLDGSTGKLLLQLFVQH